MTFSGGGAPNEFSTLNVSIGNMGKESAAEWSYIEQNAPTGSGCPGTVNCNHTYDWSVLDGYVSTAASHNLPFMYFFTEAPPWATGSVGCRTISVGQACRGPVLSSHTADQQAFVTALVTRYNGNNGHGLISSYELGNEEDYEGTFAQYAAQSDLIVKAIKAVNPSAMIVGMGWDHPDGHYAQGGDFDQFWAAWGAIPENSRHLDVVSYHGYPHDANVVPEIVISGAGASGGVGNCASTGYAPCIQAAIARNNVTTFAGGTPALRDTEGSWGHSISSSFQPAYVARMLLLTWAAGVNEQLWYAWDGGSTFGQLSGIPANTSAYQQTYKWMVGSTMTSPCAIQSGAVWTCALTESSGKSALAVWDTTGPSSYSITAGTYSDYKDLSGNTNTVAGGTTSVSIGLQPILLEGNGNGSSPPAAPSGLTAIVQ